MLHANVSFSDARSPSIVPQVTEFQTVKRRRTGPRHFDELTSINNLKVLHTASIPVLAKIMSYAWLNYKTIRMPSASFITDHTVKKIKT